VVASYSYNETSVIEQITEISLWKTLLTIIESTFLDFEKLDIFLKYFESVQQYDALILAGNFEKLEGIIKEQSNFKIEEK
jgi:hypothetical protein